MFKLYFIINGKEKSKNFKVLSKAEEFITKQLFDYDLQVENVIKTPITKEYYCDNHNRFKIFY